MSKATTRLLLLLNVLLVIMTLGSYVAPYISAAQLAIIPLLGLVYPALLVANIVAVGLWLFTEKKYAWLSIIVIVIGYSSCTKLIQFNPSTDDSTTAIRIASYNCNFLKPVAFAKDASRPGMEAEFVSFLQKLKPQVLCVQEDGWRSHEQIQAAMDYAYVHQEKGYTVSIYSEFPIVDSGMVDFQSNIANTCLWVDVDINTDTLRIYNTHLESNRHDGIVPAAIVAEVPEHINNSVLLGIARHFQKFTLIRTGQAKKIQSHRKAAPYPAIICGDMNDTPQSQVYTTVRDDMQDTFLEKGCGIGSTYSKKIPGLRIDHIFVDPKLSVVNHEIVSNKFSDHKLLLVQLGL